MVRVPSAPCRHCETDNLEGPKGDGEMEMVKLTGFAEEMATTVAKTIAWISAGACSSRRSGWMYLEEYESGARR